ncbi:MAG: hypothetical protein IT367_18135 [Candidatus Hydrogenedentes bacterium]|nr:hypothetical protein [Candidatus Hydrogenedentota bacterium]
MNNMELASELNGWKFYKSQPDTTRRPLARMDSPKGKTHAYYSFQNEDRRDRWIVERMADLIAKETRRKQNAEAKRTARETFANPYKPGDIFVNSWGWEQTNIDFYECVAVGKCSLTLRPIAANVTETQSMAGHATPRPGHFTGEAFKKNIQVYAHNGKPAHYIKAEYGCMSLWDGKPEFCSWYA